MLTVSADEVAQWGVHTSAGFACHSFPGGHFCLADHLIAVTDMLRASAVVACQPSAAGDQPGGRKR